MQQGKLIIFSAPSGAGKTTIVKHLLEVQDFNLAFSISACSRPPRKGEINGKDYFFLPISDFKSKIKDNQFIEFEEVYTDNYYGTLKSEIKRLRNEGKNVIFDVDVVGGINLKKYFKEESISFFVMPPSLKELENRLKNRDTEKPEAIKKRLEKATFELNFAPQFDFIIKNDILERAVNQTKQILKKFLRTDG